MPGSDEKHNKEQKRFAMRRVNSILSRALRQLTDEERAKRLAKIDESLGHSAHTGGGPVEVTGYIRSDKKFIFFSKLRPKNKGK